MLTTADQHWIFRCTERRQFAGASRHFEFVHNHHWLRCLAPHMGRSPPCPPVELGKVWLSCEHHCSLLFATDSELRDLAVGATGDR